MSLNFTPIIRRIVQNAKDPHCWSGQYWKRDYYQAIRSATHIEDRESIATSMGRYGSYALKKSWKAMCSTIACCRVNRVWSELPFDFETSKCLIVVVTVRDHATIFKTRSYAWSIFKKRSQMSALARTKALLSALLWWEDETGPGMLRAVPRRV